MSMPLDKMTPSPMAVSAADAYVSADCCASPDQLLTKEARPQAFAGKNNPLERSVP